MKSSYDWQLDNWILWCRRKNWLPMAHVCQLAALIKQAKQEMQSATDTVTPVFDDRAEAFDKLVTNLPNRYREVFLLDHLDKGIRGQMIIYSRQPSVKYRLAGVSKSTFYERAREAENMLKRWTS